MIKLKIKPKYFIKPAVTWGAVSWKVYPRVLLFFRGEYIAIKSNKREAVKVLKHLYSSDIYLDSDCDE